jgi:hypothetical protein
MISQDVYNQIDIFVNQKDGRSKYPESRFYVDTETAEDKASFINFLSNENEILENKKHYKAIDLCYGSGSLTAHIFGDTDIGYSELYLNDLNTDDRNNNISIGTKLDYDFLDASKFTTQYDLIVFNPQIGGKDTYSKGLVDFEKIESIIYDGSFESYLNSNGIDTSQLSISIDEDEKSIIIHSNSMSKTDMKETFKDIKIFNYYDVFFHSKETKIEGEYTNIVQFRKTLEKISHDNTIVVFYGEMNYYNYLFADYTNVRIYLQDSTKQLFVLAKDKIEKKCYEKIENEFIENKKCEIEKSIGQEDLDIGELMKELENNEVGKNFDGVLKSESKNSKLIESNEEQFKEWWLTSTYNSVDEKPYSEITKKAYLRALKQLNTQLVEFGFDNIDVFKISDIDDLNKLLLRLENEDLYKFNIRNKNRDTSNGLKQYIKFINGESNKNEIALDEQQEDITMQENNTFEFSNNTQGSLDFEYKNILFKGVPGTGKSRAIDNIIKDNLKLDKNSDNILRVNIHSASSNSDLMQGIGITTNGNNVIYKEKQGLIFEHIRKACFAPLQPFVLILEEIQENSLNELIGDLIYLIEPSKRMNIDKIYDLDPDEFNGKELLYFSADKEDGIINKYIQLAEDMKDNDPNDEFNVHSVKIPYLIETGTAYKEMILPNNLFVFCTSNYRDDKKIIEDNLLRRFEVIEIYPKSSIASKETQEFFDTLNNAILDAMSDEIHPDRFMIGHAIFKDVLNEKDFYRRLLKVVTEFKDIKEIDFENFKDILEKCKNKYPFGIQIDIHNTYKDLIVDLQTKIDYDFLKDNE